MSPVPIFLFAKRLIVKYINKFASANLKPINRVGINITNITNKSMFRIKWYLMS